GAGSKVGEVAGRNIKKVVLELGGSDPFIVREDADLDDAVTHAVTGRLQNNGQSCIAAKRYIVNEKVADQFVKKLKEKFESQNITDPMNKECDLGPVVNKESLEELQKMINDSVSMGAKI